MNVYRINRKSITPKTALADKILSTSENAGIVDLSTGEILIKISETPDISLELDRAILPYQGFEVHWDTDSKTKDKEKKTIG